MEKSVMRKYLVVLLAIGVVAALMLGLLGCGSSGSTSTTAAASATTAKPQTLTVSAASSLKDAFTEIGKAFDAANNCKTTFNFAASGTLQKQIEGGAPVDVFASAAMKQVTALTDKQLADVASVREFAGNEIVLVVPTNSTLGLTRFQDLTKANVGKITYGDPKVAPNGVAAEQILTKVGILSILKSKIVYAADVSQALTYVKSGEVDAGIVFASEATSAGDKVKVIAKADQSWYTKVVYPAVLVSASEKKELGQKFIDYLMSSDGQAILAKYGFLPAPVK
jgi:molybdate transport system substrate-binding protein